MGLGWFPLMAISVLGVWLIIGDAWVADFFVLLFVMLGLIGSRNEQTKRAAFRRYRRGVSICGFARSFNCRETDTWVVRAVYEEMERHIGAPVRKADRLADLQLDDDDAEDIVQDVADRTYRSLNNGKQNPLYGRVETVGDMVSFLNHQPRRVCSPAAR